ncbi:carbon storage regulator [Thalassoroseus pseudoceratinae]|uniref:carbon storage regulator n=1 Tax=Thalassoroseus pseudoceratinae TaxID=2713176 RepID=UPI001F0F287C|nr:carbon storage regulator [Thalassoroseus pseudoceratinae]
MTYVKYRIPIDPQESLWHTACISANHPESNGQQKLNKLTKLAPSNLLDNTFQQLTQQVKGIPMLVLTRKTSEMIQVGDDIVIKVIRTGKSTVKIGIEAPSNVRVLRAELCDEAEPVATPNANAVTTRDTNAASLSVCSDQYPHVA